MDDLERFIQARNAAIEAVEAAKPLIKAAEDAIEAAMEAGRIAEIKTSKVREGLPVFSCKVTMPHQGEG